MYANLKVTTAQGKELAAWKVVVHPGYTEVHLDDDNLDSSYAEPKGMLRLRGLVTVEANW